MKEKTMKNTLKALLLATALCAVAVPVHAQLENCPNCEMATATVVDNGDGALACWYVGSGASGFITVASGSLTLESPDASTADTSVECPVSGALGGVIDLTNAACNSIQKVLDQINTPASNFRCVPLGAVGADTVNTMFTTSTDSDAGGEGFVIKWLTANRKSTTLMVAPAAKASLSSFYQPGIGGNRQKVIMNDAWFSKTPLLYTARNLATYTGAPAFTLISVKYRMFPYTLAASGANVGYKYIEATGSPSTVYNTAAMGASTVDRIFGGCDTPATACDTAWGTRGFLGTKGEKLLARFGAVTTWGTVTQTTTGVLLSDRSQPF